MEVKQQEDKKKGSFYVEENGEHLADLEYFHSAAGQITIYHTAVDEKLRGQKVGDKLVAAAVNYSRGNDLKVVPTCAFAKKVIDRTPEYQDILA